MQIDHESSLGELCPTLLEAKVAVDNSHLQSFSSLCVIFGVIWVRKENWNGFLLQMFQSVPNKEYSCVLCLTH